MVDQSIVDSIHNYLRTLEERRIPVAFGVLLGSYAKDRADEWSDIDLVVVSPIFDPAPTREHRRLLRKAAYDTDIRIEPIPCGERQWIEDDERAIIEIARREGQRISIAQVA